MEKYQLQSDDQLAFTIPSETYYAKNTNGGLLDREIAVRPESRNCITISRPEYK